MNTSHFNKSLPLLFLNCFLMPGNSYHQDGRQQKIEIIQLTKDETGHCLYNTQCFSPDDEWIVFDSRNDDTHIGRTSNISMVNTKNSDIKDFYHTQHQTLDGPGVGAASFSPKANRVLFIHGIRNADKANPYSFTRRTGVAVDMDKPFQPVFMDARDIKPPFTKGALRGGTHAHTWSGDGHWISFTYNDYVLQQLEKTDSSVKDLRTVGVMIPRNVEVRYENGLENNSGAMFSVLVAEVTEHPTPGSDEVSKAYDEGWIGTDGYAKTDGSWQRKAIAFQGDIKTVQGKDKTEIFVIDLPGDLTKERPGLPLEGTVSTRPNVPAGVKQRRITYTAKGVEGPRHWLRTSADGRIIAFLSKDHQGIVQVFSVSPNGGNVRQITFNKESIEGPFNFSPDGKKLAYIAGKTVCVSDIKTGNTIPLTPKYNNEEFPTGSVIWSHSGDMIAFNRYIKSKQSAEKFLQIFLLKMKQVKK